MKGGLDECWRLGVAFGFGDADIACHTLVVGADRDRVVPRALVALGAGRAVLALSPCCTTYSLTDSPSLEAGRG